MATVKALKLLVPPPVALDSGRDGLRTIIVTDDTPELILPYSVIVNENKFSNDCNKVLIDQYIERGIFTLVDVTVPDVTALELVEAMTTGEDLTYMVTATGDDIHYEWSITDLPPTTWTPIGTDDPSVSVPVIENDGRIIQVKVINGATYEAQTINVWPIPTILGQPEEVLVPVALAENLTYDVVGSMPLPGETQSFEWSIANAVPGTGWAPVGTDSSLVSIPAIITTPRILKVTISNDSTYIESDVIPVPDVPVITVEPVEHVQVAIGANMDFSVTATGSDLHYYWSIADTVPGTVWTDAGATASITVVAIADTARKIKCRVFNNGTYVESSTVAVLAGS